MEILLSEATITGLAKPIVKMLPAIEDFYNNPKNEEGYRNWYFKKYGCEPKE